MNGNSNATLHIFKNVSINISGNVNIAMSEVVADCLKLYACVMRICNNNSNNASILFMHGTSGNEILSRKSAKKLKAVYPRTEIRSFDGYSHGELAIYHPADWIKEVETFISAAE